MRHSPAPGRPREISTRGPVRASPTGFGSVSGFQTRVRVNVSRHSGVPFARGWEIRTIPLRGPFSFGERIPIVCALCPQLGDVPSGCGRKLRRSHGSRTRLECAPCRLAFISCSVYASRDGAAALCGIKEVGGITIAQKLDAAGQPGMPESAIATECIDLVLSPEDIAQEIVQIARAASSVD